ncbi:hypothetical protein [Nostoc sp. KVJ3]|uniref:hypothetical protein n=1 Tax=Nostoc sp. KVJ3 TaxID=457945 RepID=UPI0022373169|nr:hypothetical protein [Nostoc sp. KVJ3]
MEEDGALGMEEDGALGMEEDGALGMEEDGALGMEDGALSPLSPSSSPLPNPTNQTLTAAPL